MGKLYRDGDFVPCNIVKAMELFASSAEQENENAAYQLGRLYLSGQDIPRDVDAAVRWLTLSADLNNQFAQYALAKLYLAGEEIQQDVSKAMELFLQSANQKNDYAQYQLGKLYFAGNLYQKMWIPSSAGWTNRQNRGISMPNTFLESCIFAERMSPMTKKRRCSIWRHPPYREIFMPGFFWIIWIPLGIHLLS
ncbi:tetratricopeptide repeat protein [Eisenbergiella sp.]